MRLLVDYFGGSKRVWNQVEGTNVILRTPPCCCCIVCLPVIKFDRWVSDRWQAQSICYLVVTTVAFAFYKLWACYKCGVQQYVIGVWQVTGMWQVTGVWRVKGVCVCDRRVFTKLQMLVMQVALVRPLLMFIAAVLWADGAYTPGVVSVHLLPDWLIWIIVKSYWLKPFNWTNKRLMTWLLYYLATDSSKQCIHLHSNGQRVIDNVGSVRAHRAQKYILRGVERIQHWRQVHQPAVGTAAVRHPQSLPQHPRSVRRHSLWCTLLVQGPRRAWVTCVHILTNAF